MEAYKAAVQHYVDEIEKLDIDTVPYNEAISDLEGLSSEGILARATEIYEEAFGEAEDKFWEDRKKEIPMNSLP